MDRIFNLLIKDTEATKNYRLSLEVKKYLIEVLIFTALIGVILTLSVGKASSIEFSIQTSVYLIMISLMISFCGVVVGNQIIDMFRILKNPTKDILKPISKSVKEQEELTQRLIIFNAGELEQAIERIEYDIKRIKFRIGILVGAIERLGLIPFAIALYISVIKFLQTHEMEIEQIFGLAFIGGIYLGALLCSEVLQRFEYYLLVLNSAKKNVVAKEKNKIPMKDKINQLKSQRL